MIIIHYYRLQNEYNIILSNLYDKEFWSLDIELKFLYVLTLITNYQTNKTFLSIYAQQIKL